MRYIAHTHYHTQHTNAIFIRLYSPHEPPRQTNKTSDEFSLFVIASAAATAGDVVVVVDTVLLGLATAVALVYQAELWVLLLHHLSNHYNKKSYSHTKAFNLQHIRAAVVVSGALYLVICQLLRVLCRSRFQFRTYFQKDVAP